MASISMVELRRNAERVLHRVGQGERLVLTHRGKPVARLEPIEEPAMTADDPIYRLAESSIDEGGPLDNDEIDAIVYGR